jgi:E3 ubiquitin-protein ligase MARCH6
VPASARALSTGETKPNGERVLRFGSDFIRLPIRLPGRFLRSRSVLLPTRIGKFRLKRDAFNSINPVIQIWEEVPGEPIQRPPAGWDDLGAGGADVQGRWAWGSEKKSKIEEGVASRRPFFELDQPFAASVFVLVKLLFIGFLSWLACTALLCLALTVPLTVGRAFYTIFRVPDRWVHDPLAFGLGFGIVFPFVDKATRLGMTSELSVGERLLSWLQQLYIPPRRKFFVMLEATFLWVCVAPFLLGLIYEIIFLKSDAWFKGDEPVFDRKSLLLSSLSGFIILDLWASLCVLGVFTGKIRGLIAIGDEDNALNRNLDNEQEGEDNSAEEDGPTSLSWQGANGRLARFSDTFREVVVNWEWDRVDEVVLLKECARPIVHALLTTSLVSLLFVSAFGYAFSDSSGRVRAVLTRLTLFVVCCIQLGIAWKDQLWKLAEVAHKTARDDRYLIGEILLNYGDE